MTSYGDDLYGKNVTADDVKARKVKCTELEVDDKAEMGELEVGVLKVRGLGFLAGSGSSRTEFNVVNLTSAVKPDGAPGTPGATPGYPGDLKFVYGSGAAGDDGIWYCAVGTGIGTGNEWVHLAA